MKSLIISLFILLIPSILFATGENDSISYKPLVKFPVMGMSTVQYAKIQLKNTTVSNDISMAEYQLFLNFVVKLKEKKTYLFNGVDFSTFRFSLDSQTHQSFDKGLYSLAYKIGIIQVLKNRWQLIGFITPTLASDLKSKLSTEDFVLQSTLMINKRHNEYMEYGFGLSFNTRFGRELLVPVFVFNYKKRNWSSINAFPGFLSGYYHFGNSKIGLSASIFGNLYNYTDTQTHNKQIDKVSYSRILLGPKFQTKLYRDIYLKLSLGTVLMNMHEVYNDDDQLYMEPSSKEKFFFNMAINFLK